jgi:23S rRNA (pseudouridine1915-N3)-methyltransferase
MRLLVLVVGKDSKDPLKQAAESFLNRTQVLLKPEFVYIAESKRRENPQLASEEEGKLLLKASEGCFRIAMDATGKMRSSDEFASEIQRVMVHERMPVAFLIGGATGLSKTVLEACRARWSLSPMTLPHRLAYLVLAEQIYRAGEILRGGPYHK